MAIDNSASDRTSQIYRQRWWTLVIISLAWGITVIGNSILNVALPTLQRELDASASDLQWMVNVYPLTLAALLITMGSVGDRFGRAHALRAGVIIFAGGSILAITANSPEIVIASRVIMGIGAAAIAPATLAIIMYIFPVDERGKAVAIWSSILGIAIALGPIVGGLLIKFFSWHAIFFFNIPFAIVVLIVGIFIIPNSRSPNVQRVDIPGMLLSAAGLGTLVYGLTKAGDLGWTDSIVIGCFVGATALIALFILWERHASSPMLDIGMFTNSRFSVGAACILLAVLIYLGTLFALTLYMQFVRGYSALETGIRFLPWGIGYIVGARTSYQQVDRIGIKWTISAALVLLAAILVSMSFWSVHTSYWVIALTIFMVAFCIGNVSPPSTASIVSSLPVSRAGAASATSPLSNQVGGSIGVALLGSILATQYTSSMTTALSGKVNISTEVAASAKESVGSAIAVADKLPVGVGETVRTAAHSSFMDGWQLMALVACVIVIIGAILAFRFLPQRALFHPEGTETKGPSDHPIA
jgi:EmrB/QacA subfamily drug resistance transporter